MNYIKTFTFIFLSLLWSVKTIAVETESFIGLSVIKDAENPLIYGNSNFAINPIGSFNLSRLNGEKDIYNYLSSMNAGKQVVNYLLNYQFSKMDYFRFSEHMSPDRAKNPQENDYKSAILNNYLLIIKMDEKSRKKALLGETTHFTPTGNWYLYQLQCDNSTYQSIKKNIIYPSDSPEIKGEKRVNYERISIPIKLVSSGKGISKNLNQRLAKTIKYITINRIDSNLEQTRKTSTILKMALSPFLILKK